MKKLIAFILITLAVSAQAQHYHNNHYRGGNWVAPMVIGGVVGYALSRNYNEPIYNYGYVPPPVVVQQAPVIVQQPVISVCTPWTETQQANGTITRTRTCQ
jgi:hypothetical protein